MRRELGLHDQITQMQQDPVRIVISGAGVAGLTLAQLLRRRGLHPALVERSGRGDDRGYMIGLMPIVWPAFDELGVEDAYRQRSVLLNRYTVRGRHGQPVATYDFGELLGEFGEYRGISHGALLDVIASEDAPVSFGTTITSVTQQDSAVTIAFSDGEEAEADLLIVAEGIHSTTRDLIVPSERVSSYDSGWGGWVTWLDPDEETDLYLEDWGVGGFVGTYPVRDAIGAFVGGARGDLRQGPAAFIARLREQLPEAGPRVTRALDVLAAANDPYFWSFVDVRSDVWSTGRIGLLGDSAAGFLPTAGIGAGMAIESAHQLAAFLRDADAGDIPEALRRFETSQRPRVEAAQDNSRVLARLMFRRSRTVAVVRDVVTRFLPLSLALGPIRKLVETAPGRDAA